MFRIMTSYNIKIHLYIFLSFNPDIIFSHAILNAQSS
jgi:hypothetical protein